MIENGLEICSEAELMDIHPFQRRDVLLGDNSDENFIDPPPPTSWVRGCHSVSHTSGTGKDIHLYRDFQTPPRSSVWDAFFYVDLEMAIIPDTPNPLSKYSQGLRSLFMLRRRRD
ncbi:hypothetical protein AAHA92_17130 [Salvia divinorum]|uniref:Uncharacterized protein n=1 Tax=Salvia divinorum TaxID=28513 RepID=A0ABD1GXT4_SALDI